MSTSHEIPQEQSHNWRGIASRVAAVAGISIASLGGGNTVQAEDGPYDGCGMDLDSAGGWYSTGVPCDGEAPAPTSPPPTQTTQPRPPETTAPRPEPRPTNPPRDSGGSNSGGSGSEGSDSDGDSRSSERDYQSSSENSSDGNSQAGGNYDAPVRLSWIEKVMQNCEGQEGDPVTADAHDAAYNPAGLTESERGSPRFAALVRYCNRAFMDLNGDHVVDEKDVDPATGHGVSNFSLFLEDILIVFPPDESNLFTPNLANVAIDDADEAADWQVLFPPEPVVSTVESTIPVTNVVTATTLSGFAAGPTTTH